MSTVDTQASRRRPNVSTLKMGLFLYVAGPVKPTEVTINENVIHCEGLNNQSYVCEVGHCCGNTQCCSYYYELWWFWLVWAIIFILSCCCVCHHRRTKHRLQQQQRQHEINLIAYREAHNYNSMPFYLRFLPNYLLPDYEEVVNRPPTPPPPYSALHTTAAALPSGAHSPGDQPSSLLLPPSLQTSPHAPPTPDALLSSSRPRPGPEGIGDPPPGYHQHKTPEEEEPVVIGGLEKRRSTGSSGSAGDLQKEPLLGGEMQQPPPPPPPPPGVGGKERGGGGRHRRFTGDSGIEVCVCGRGGGAVVGGELVSGGGGHRGSLEIRDPKAELEGLLSAEQERDDDDSGGGGSSSNGNGFPDDFCEACSHRCDTEGQVAVERRGAESRGASPSSQPHPPVCLLLHTINEQETPPCTATAEPHS
ncbi:WW domain binding protein 1-like b [Alosa pseudoharengus]|uniref:WW domain binding protein 1-like b n=1 Tax=Alosa pseudoharengus TaxID=34774 RepID=UPI003F8A54F1